MKISLPFRTVSTPNAREHWAAKARRSKTERNVTRHMVDYHLKARLSRYTVVLTRKGPRALDSDNLAASFKAIRDGVADAIGIDDGSDKVQWRYRQEKSKTYSVEIEIGA